MTVDEGTYCHMVNVVTSVVLVFEGTETLGSRNGSPATASMTRHPD